MRAVLLTCCLLGLVAVTVAQRPILDCGGVYSANAAMCNRIASMFSVLDQKLDLLMTAANVQSNTTFPIINGAHAGTVPYSFFSFVAICAAATWNLI